MSRLIDRAELFNRLANIKAPPEANEYKAEVYSLIQSMETADTVSKGVFDQVKWERDTALKTLEEHGIGFGEMAERRK